MGQGDTAEPAATTPKEFAATDSVRRNNRNLLRLAVNRRK
jgi:hypothetical protein